MTPSPLKIRSVKARPVDAPLERPVRTAVGTIPSAPLVLIDVLTEEGVTGSAYVFAYTPLALAPLARLIEEIGKELSGKSIVPFDRMREFNRRFRLLGWQGLVGMAVAGLDMAFWDALGKAAGWPVVRLLGGEPRPMMAYDSYGVLDMKTDASVIARSVESGLPRRQDQAWRRRRRKRRRDRRGGAKADRGQDGADGRLQSVAEPD